MAKINTATTSLAGKQLNKHSDKRAYAGLNIRGYRLTDAVLDGLDLTGTDFAGSDLTGASLVGCILNRANFRDADVEEEQLRAALSAKQVMMPDGTVKTLVEGPDHLPAPAAPAFQLEELEAMLQALQDSRARRGP